MNWWVFSGCFPEIVIFRLPFLYDARFGRSRHDELIFDLKIAVFWDVSPYRSRVNRRFRWTCRLHPQGREIRERGTSVIKWLAAHAGSTLADICTLKMEATRSSETSVYTWSTRHHISDDYILHSYRCENLRNVCLVNVCVYIEYAPKVTVHVYCKW
jgi:hypothetical protein